MFQPVSATPSSGSYLNRGLEFTRKGYTLSEFQLTLAGFPIILKCVSFITATKIAT